MKKRKGELVDGFLGRLVTYDTVDGAEGNRRAIGAIRNPHKGNGHAADVAWSTAIAVAPVFFSIVEENPGPENWRALGRKVFAQVVPDPKRDSDDSTHPLQPINLGAHEVLYRASYPDANDAEPDYVWMSVEWGKAGAEMGPSRIRWWSMKSDPGPLPPNVRFDMVDRQPEGEWHAWEVGT